MMSSPEKTKTQNRYRTIYVLFCVRKEGLYQHGHIPACIKNTGTEEPQMDKNFITSFLTSFQVMLMLPVSDHTLKTTALAQDFSSLLQLMF